MHDMSPLHGGDLARAISLWGGRPADWIDCSTGIAPQAYPLPVVPATVWQQLPHGDAALLAAARAYYGCHSLLAVPGSQAAISLLPTLRPACRVGIISLTYAEHAWQWQKAGHCVIEIATDHVTEQLPSLDVLIVVNPNNPTGTHWPRATLLAWHAALAEKNGWLIVDEAFADAIPTESLIADSDLPGLIVLRSLGKFFGLAGLRLGFVGAEASLLARLAIQLGPWAVSGPAQWAGEIALLDTDWQKKQRAHLAANAQWLARTLRQFGLVPTSSRPLLCWCPTMDAALWQATLARQFIWCRRFETGLRFGPIAAQNEFIRRLELASQTVKPAQTGIPTTEILS